MFFRPTVLWTTRNRKCVLQRRDPSQTLLDIVVFENDSILKHEFFVDDQQAVDFVIAEWHATGLNAYLSRRARERRQPDFTPPSRAAATTTADFRLSGRCEGVQKREPET